MRKELFVGLNVDLYPRQSFGAGDVVLRDGAKTDRLFVVLGGRLAVGIPGKSLGPGDVVKPIEFFGASHYAGEVRARAMGQIAILPRAAVRDCLDAQGEMTWNLACAIAIEALAASKEHA
jgi:CRP-like cAMP-binding protein